MATVPQPPERLFGLGPAETEMGDIVYILAGCTVPVILRSIQDSAGCFELIGEAFVYGQMDGEAMSAFEQTGQGMEWFNLV